MCCCLPFRIHRLSAKNLSPQWLDKTCPILRKQINHSISGLWRIQMYFILHSLDRNLIRTLMDDIRSLFPENRSIGSRRPSHYLVAHRRCFGYHFQRISPYWFLKDLHRRHLLLACHHPHCYCLLLQQRNQVPRSFTWLCPKILKWKPQHLFVHSSLHSIDNRINCADYFPALRLLFSKQHLHQLLQLCQPWNFGHLEHFGIHLGTSIPKRCM